MDATYDIFYKSDSDGAPIWVEAVQGLESAKQRLSKLRDTHPGDYFVYDPTTAKIISRAA